MKVSIVIPCYNVEKYIHQCIDSLLVQTHSDFELICVDDCSTDTTWTILQEFERKDKRVRIFRLNENSKSARLPRIVGISMAVYSFVCAVDADDFVDETYLDKLIKRQSETQADIVLTRMVGFEKVNDRLFSIPCDGFDYNQVLSGKEAVMLTINGWKIGFAGVLIRKKLWEKQRKDSSASEMNHGNADEYDTRALLIMAEKVAFTDVCYSYRQYPESITKNIDRSFDVLITNKMLVDLFKEVFGGKSNQLRKVQGDFLNSIVYCYVIYNHKKRSLKNSDRAFYLIKSHFSHLSVSDIYHACSDWRIKLISMLPFFLFRFLLTSLLKVRRYVRK